MRVSEGVSAEAELAIRRISALLLESGPHSSTLTTAVATTEAHVDATIEQLLCQSQAQRSRLGAFLIDRSVASFRQSWTARQELLHSGFGIDVKPQSLVQHLSLVVSARNALAHGDGSLTAVQVSNWSKANELRRNLELKLGARVQGRSITFTPESLKTAVEMLIDYIVGLDTAVSRVR